MAEEESEFFVGREAFHPATWHMLRCTAAPLLQVDRAKTHVLSRCPACPAWFYWESR